MAVDLKQELANLEKDKVLEEVKRRAEAGEDVNDIIDELSKGMTMVGDAFERGDGFLAELMLSGDIFQEAFKVLAPYIKKDGSKTQVGKVIIGTLRGDIHDIGKNIVATLLRSNGFDVLDLGVDVPLQKVVDTAKEYKPDYIGFSSLLTPNFKEMKACTDMLREAGLLEHTKIMIGGGVTNEKTREFVGADYQSINAMQTVQYCLDNIGKF